jgi:uncharacterized membrane protein YkoI
MNKQNRSNAHLKISATVFFSAITLAACTEKSSEIEIPLSEVPANIVSIVQNTLPGISLVEAEKEIRDEIVIYELEGKLINGKEYEIKIAADGTIIKIELED